MSTPREHQLELAIPPPPPAEDATLDRLAHTLHALIEASPYSAADVARRLRVDRSAVTRWTQGRRTPALHHLIDLAQLLGVEMADLWNGHVTTTPELRALLVTARGLSRSQQQALLAIARTMRRS